jgi:DNA mismatch endonuclease (patch repair protein)
MHALREIKAVMAKRRPYRPRSAESTSRIMSRVRSKNSKAELVLRRQLWSDGFRYRLHARYLRGTPDVVFRSIRLCVFVDGDFWHARSYIEKDERTLRRSLRTVNREWWVAKLVRNAKRDRSVTAQLQVAGWKVLRFWETDILRNPAHVAEAVERAVQSRRCCSLGRVSKRHAAALN